MEDSTVQPVLLKEVEIETDMLVVGGGGEEASRVRVQSPFKELSPILTARGASHRGA